MKYMPPTIKAMSANDPPAMIATCVLAEMPRLPIRSMRSGWPVAPDRNAVPHFGQVASSKETISWQLVHGQPVGFVSSAEASAKADEAETA